MVSVPRVPFVFRTLCSPVVLSSPCTALGAVSLYTCLYIPVSALAPVSFSSALGILCCMFPTNDRNVGFNKACRARGKRVNQGYVYREVNLQYASRPDKNLPESLPRYLAIVSQYQPHPLLPVLYVLFVNHSVSRIIPLTDSIGSCIGNAPDRRNTFSDR